MVYVQNTRAPNHCIGARAHERGSEFRTKIFRNAQFRLENDNVKCGDSFSHKVYKKTVKYG